jgi:hypothetical protein
MTTVPMKFYMIRHKRTGEFMPLLRRHGYIFWNPDHPSTVDMSEMMTGVPRMLPSERTARQCIARWVSSHNQAVAKKEASHSGIMLSTDGRKKDDLEIVVADMIATRRV